VLVRGGEPVPEERRLSGARDADENDDVYCAVGLQLLAMCRNDSTCSALTVTFVSVLTCTFGFASDVWPFRGAPDCFVSDSTLFD
jgi:hypothetical protein